MIMNGGYVIDNLRIKIVYVYSCFQLWVHILLFDKQELSTNYRGYLPLWTGLVRVIDVWCMEGNMTLWSCDHHDSHL